MGGRGAWSSRGQTEAESAYKNADNEITYEHLGHLGGFDVLEAEFGEIQTDEVILTQPQKEHILERHPEVEEYLETHSEQLLQGPDMIVRELGRKGTVHYVLSLPNTNLKAIVKLTLADDTPGNKNSIISMQLIRNRSLGSFIEKNKVIYKKGDVGII